MNSKIFFQDNEDNTLSAKISSNFSLSPKKVYIFSGSFKEGGLKILEEEMIDNKAKVFFAIGIDKKNTTKLMLNTLLGYTGDIYVFDNNDIIEFDSSICIFEFKDKAVIYTLSSNFSESGLINNTSIYFEIVYDLKNIDDKKEYKDIIKKMLNKIQSEDSKFKKLSKDMIEDLQEKKEIFTTKQYVHNVKSISELLGKNPVIKKEVKKITKDEIDDIYISDKSIPKIEINDSDLKIDDIDISEIDSEPEIKIKKDNKSEEKIKEKNIESEDKNNFDDEDLIENDDSLDFDENSTLDIAEMLFSKADLKLDVNDAKKHVETSKENLEKYGEEELVKVKKVNLNNISNFIFELPNKTKTRQNENILKIPNYIQRMIPNFFELVDNSKTVQKEDGMYKIREINLEVVDAKTANKYTDREAKISCKVGQSYIVFQSDILNNIDYSELDIARIIKLDSNIYHIEFIKKDMQEYKLWNKLCNQKFKSTTRSYGMM